MLLDKGSNENYAIMVAGITCFIIVIISILSYFKRKDGKLAPLAPAGMMETLRSIGGPNGPWFVLKMKECTNSDIFRVRIPTPRGAYFVGCPDAAREVLLDKKSDKDRLTYSVFDSITGQASIFSRTSGPKWHNSRKNLAHSFSSHEITRMRCICTKHLDRWIENKLEPCIKNNESFDPSEEMWRITFQVILETAFEYTDTDDNDFFLHHLEVALKEFALKSVLNPLRKVFGPLLSDYREALTSCKIVQTFARKVLDTYRKNPNKSKNKTIIRMINENESYTSDKERISDMIVLLIAGHDTTGFTIANLLVTLAKHPNITENLRQELLSMEPSKWSQSSQMRNALNENIRLYPTIPIGSVRVPGRDIICKEGSIILPKGCLCFIPQILTHRNERVFPDPDLFLPHRWENADKKMRDAIMPFSLGNRNCLGQSFAMSEIYTVIPRLITNYRFEIETEGQFDYFLTIKHAGARLKPSRVQ